MDGKTLKREVSGPRWIMTFKLKDVIQRLEKRLVSGEY